MSRRKILETERGWREISRHDILYIEISWHDIFRVGCPNQPYFRIWSANHVSQQDTSRPPPFCFQNPLHSIFPPTIHRIRIFSSREIAFLVSTENVATRKYNLNRESEMSRYLVVQIQIESGLNLNLYQGIWVSRFSGFLGVACRVESVMSRDDWNGGRDATVDQRNVYGHTHTHTHTHTHCMCDVEPRLTNTMCMETHTHTHIHMEWGTWSHGWQMQCIWTHTHTRTHTHTHTHTQAWDGGRRSTVDKYNIYGHIHTHTQTHTHTHTDTHTQTHRHTQMKWGARFFFCWWVLQHCTGFARLIWGRLRVHRAFTNEIRGMT